MVLLRHGQTEYNADNRMQGQLDTELSPLGRDQAKSVATVLAERAPLRVVSSDLSRAADTARALGEAAGLAVATDERLRETHLGEWQGLTHVDVDARWPGARVDWRADATAAPPGGESRLDAARRSRAVIDELVREESEWGERPIVVVAHGGVIAALTASLLGLAVPNWPVLGGLGNTSWAQLSAHDTDAELQWRLDVWNASAKVAGDVL
nr:histidine phosphatase family protein [Rhodococcus sp. HNM0569]